MGPTRWPRTELVEDDGPKNRWFTEPAAGGWSQPVIMEWELTAESWTDEHVHDEYAYVLQGVLFVECDGVTVEARTGDMVRVPGGSVGRYWAPDHARMLGIYAPNPDGVPMTNAVFEKLPASARKSI
ncbi:cupin domain-containing protein [Methylopila sp. M107]|uniref:cupin domain-containing protein n=1 Tax=Methylopila sp. M107 TaxID=1101190 RepID=UPI000360C96D|nr:cupin domain-containing protein [Methylopila sp. M107]